MNKTIGVMLVVFMSFGLTSCFSLLGSIYGSSSSESSEVPKAVEIVYIEIPYSELDSSIKGVNSPGQGFIVEAYFVVFYGDGSFSISDTPDGLHSRIFGVHDGGDGDREYRYSYIEPHQFETYNTQTYKRIDKTNKYKIYFGIYHNAYGKNWRPFIDKIEGLRTMEEVAIIEAKQKAEAEAEREARAVEKEAKFNPNKLDRSKYKEITVEDFSFDMVAGNMPVGTKVAFEAKFLTKPTGTTYKFHNINYLITLSTVHNFVRDMPNYCFGPHQTLFGWEYQAAPVKIFLTVKKAGEYGECSVDIIDW